MLSLSELRKPVFVDVYGTLHMYMFHHVSRPFGRQQVQEVLGRCKGQAGGWFALLPQGAVELDDACHVAFLSLALLSNTAYFTWPPFQGIANCWWRVHVALFYGTRLAWIDLLVRAG